MAIKIREAQLKDVWQLVEMVIEFRLKQQEIGVKTIAKEMDVLRGGTILELGLTFHNPQWKYIVADKEGELVGFIVGCVEQCGPTEEYHHCLRIHGDYLKEKSLGNPRILQKMWDVLDTWAKDNGAEYCYGMIHPGNQPSIRTAKYAGFKHHMTQFIKIYKEG